MIDTSKFVRIGLSEGELRSLVSGTISPRAQKYSAEAKKCQQCVTDISGISVECDGFKSSFTSIYKSDGPTSTDTVAMFDSLKGQIDSAGKMMATVANDFNNASQFYSTLAGNCNEAIAKAQARKDDEENEGKQPKFSIRGIAVTTIFE